MQNRTEGILLLAIIISMNLLRDDNRIVAVEDNQTDLSMSLYPYFDFDVHLNVTARVGQSAFLHCRVEQLGDKSVSWMRKRDLHILTAGMLTYTSDERFQVIRPESMDYWTLQIKFAQLRDAGIYECQVNTEPKMSLPIRLNVVEAKAEIQGARELHVTLGSLVTLSCEVSQGPHELGTIHWFRGSTALDAQLDKHPNEAFYESPGRISIVTEWKDSLRSRLQISSARLTDSGNYSCQPTTAEGDSISVHIINVNVGSPLRHGHLSQGGSGGRVEVLQHLNIMFLGLVVLMAMS